MCPQTDSCDSKIRIELVDSGSSLVEVLLGGFSGGNLTVDFKTSNHCGLVLNVDNADDSDFTLRSVTQGDHSL